MLPAVHYNNNLHFHLFKFHMRTHIIKIHHRDTGINLPPCGEPPLPSNDMFEALSSTVSILQREVRYLYFYNCYYSCITNRFSNRVKSCKSCSFFADDTRVSKQIGCFKDCKLLEEDLYKIRDWSRSNNMKLHKKTFELVQRQLLRASRHPWTP